MAKQRVLIIDDDETVLDMTQQLLELGGIRSRCVQSWTEVSKVLSEQNFELILLDVMMPGMEGDALARFIRPLAPNTRIALHSSVPKHELEGRAKAAKVEHWIQKGAVSGKDLLAEVKRLLALGE